MKIEKVYKYFGTWCGPCKAYAPIFEKVVDQMAATNTEFIDIDIDKPENSDLIIKHKIKGVPTTVKVYENGDFKSKVGMMDEFQLKDFIGS